MDLFRYLNRGASRSPASEPAESRAERVRHLGGLLALVGAGKRGGVVEEIVDPALVGRADGAARGDGEPHQALDLVGRDTLAVEQHRAELGLCPGMALAGREVEPAGA